jgi:uncharacterized protein YecE (DUF72 family)
LPDISVGESPYLAGTSGWTYADWKGRFYPEKLPRTKWLTFYAGQFTAVEVNATFYRTFKDSTFRNWRERVPEGFCFVLKAPQLITHRKYLIEVEDLVRSFWGSAALLEEKLGLILLQVAPQMPYQPERLRAALKAFGDPSRVAVEFRNDHWLTSEIFGMLEELGVCFCNPDSPRERASGRLTSNTGYLRMHGRSHWYAYNYPEEELREIAGIARGMVERGAQKVYLFFNNDYQANAPRNASRLLDMLQSET